MEDMFAIGIGYVAILLPAMLLFTVLNARHKGLEKRLDALVQMARISGEVVGVDEIQLLGRSSCSSLRRSEVSPSKKSTKRKLC